ncbi:MAG: NTP transferase domain-containing protein [Paludisphaera borealis]|uniref:NTP transferase domain-containing protein n=1 Tax=Paludisphaera borealis TaxID=1387353 RepID=UPI00284898F9|nr:NTP transferase domain-containing protein [Paludisphaera borealis]MDR3623305.1 NTP transferase domain-containing protein [Paludisphaera borealis]
MTPTTDTTTIAAIVPAAGSSRRMGSPKLLLEFEGRPLIARVVSALLAGGARPVIVVTPPPDAPEGPPLAEASSRAGAVVVAPESRPAEMRDSIELAVAELERSAEPPQAVVLAPADSPMLDGSIVARVLACWRERPEAIVIPTAGGRRGHPIVVPWRLARTIADLPSDVGVNALVANHAADVVEIEVGDESVVTDLDTPDDLRRLQGQGGEVQERSVRLFAIARERAGRGEVSVRLPARATVADLRAALAEQVPELASIAPQVMIAVDSEYADDDHELKPGASLAVIPPVSGG